MRTSTPDEMRTSTPEEYPVLVIENDFLKARLLVAALQTHLGTRQIHVARDGDQAFQMIRAHDPNVILLNMNLSRPSGVEFLRLLKQNRREMNGLEIVALTQQGQGDLRSVASAMGVRHFVESPYAPKELSSTIVEATRRTE
ncbi:MAG: response regulator [Thermoanaerobaculia bacterium]|nr:response regulator [Thermoanaerobaculia bacterium]